MTRSAAQIRQEFIDFFRERGHTHVPSSPVVPHDDPTLLFANAGMNQFKPYFLGTETPKHVRVANSQKCIRAGGKHNDLDDVGHDTYHHTFFEMLGNWSFGDYFKKEAIAWAWELLTEVWGLDKSRLHATYFEGDERENLPPDVEARDLWAAVTDIDPTHIHPGNKKDNFWEMGETGPCGPCSEIHVDLTPDKSGAALVNAGDARVIEIWNLVFIQFNRGADSQLTPLPARHVDTGMGFERVTAILQGKSSNYDTDVFAALFEAIRDVTGAPPYAGTLPEEPRASARAASGTPGVSNRALCDEPRGLKPAAPQDASHASHQSMIDIAYRVIADHARCLTFAINDGCQPDREGRGYVLRRILRRAVRFGWQHLNLHEPFLCRMVDTVVDMMGDAFPELKTNPQHIKDVLREEEESFGRTLDRGIALFEEAAAFAIKHHHGEIRGEDAFKLHDTYGFPIDLTGIMAEEKNLRVDIGEYTRLMDEARIRARSDAQVVTDELMDSVTVEHLPEPVVRGMADTNDSHKYLPFPSCEATIRYVLLSPGDEGTDEIAVVTDRTCFYIEQGGQVADTGLIRTADAEIEVQYVKRIEHGIVVHKGRLVRGEAPREGQRCTLEVHPERRRPTMQNHTATHLLNWALREVLGDQVQQKGSLVDHEKTRFDFSHTRALTPEQLERVEQLVNEQIKRDLTVYDQLVPQQEALRVHGLRAVFGERYPDEVRVMSIGVPVDELLEQPDDPKWRDCSIEFCGGTHVRSTGEIEHFVLVSEEAVAKGIRRVVGLTGPAARQAEEDGAAAIADAESLRSGPPDQVAAGVARLQNALASAQLPVRHRHRLRELIGELQQIVKQQQKSLAADAMDVVNDRIDELLKSAEKIGETTIVVAEMPDVPIDQLKGGADRVKQTCKSAAILFGVRGESKATLLAAMSPDLIKKGLKAGDLVKHAAPIIKGGGGGPPTMAQAGGKDPAKLDDALSAARDWLREKLA